MGDCEESSFFLLSPAVLTEKVEISADFLIFMVFFANGVGCGGQIFFWGWVGFSNLVLRVGSWYFEYFSRMNLFPDVNFDSVHFFSIFVLLKVVF